MLFILMSFGIKAAIAQGTSIYNPINAGTIGLGQSYSKTVNNVDYDIDPGWLAGDDIVYSFTVNSAGMVNISGCGSSFDTYLSLYDSNESLIYSNDDNGPICTGTNASMQVYLEGGTYYVAIGNHYSLDQGTTSITISRSAVVNGANFANAIFAGTVLECHSLNFTDLKDNSPSNSFGNELGQASDDIFYSFTITSASTIDISTTGSAIDTYLHLLDANGDEIIANDNDGPLASGIAASIRRLLSPGTYYVVVEGSGSNAGGIQTNITAVPPVTPPSGSLMSNAINAGIVVPGISFSHSVLLTDCYQDNIGDYGNDIFYKFTLVASSTVVLSHCISPSNFTSMYLLDASGTEITRAQYSGVICSGARASIQRTLPAGTYYVAAEDYLSGYPVITNISVLGESICNTMATVPSSNQNYVMTSSPRVPFDDESQLATATSCEVQQVIQYTDGFGRAIQNIQVKGSADATKDIVTPMAYDLFGRQSTTYLPYADASNGGAYRANALTGQGTFYNYPPNGVVQTPNPYSVTVFELSSLNRIVEQGSAGATWQPVSNSNTGHTVKLEYGTNAAGEVKLWKINNNNNGSTATSYQAGKLYKTIIRDENWKPSMGKIGTTEEFKDAGDRLVLKRTWNTDLQSLNTYYVYDDFDNLRYVVPPELNEGGQNINSFDETQTLFNQFIYAYHYDGRNRVVDKKIAGKGWEYFVYNKLDQIVLSQDAIQHDKNQWSFAKFDAFGRTIMTGLYNDGTSRANLQNSVDTQADNQVPLWETYDFFGNQEYSNVSFPQANTSSLTINYYDFQGIPGNVFQYDSPPSGTDYRLRTLLTGTRVNVLGTNTMLLTVFHYDEEGRVIESKSQNHLNGVDVVSNTYNFSGDLTANTSTYLAGSVSTSVSHSYLFDHVGRRTKTYQKIGDGGTTQLLSEMAYNDIGQLKQKSLHNSLKTTSFTYNERGWLNGSSTAGFEFELKYENGTVPQYNGNISMQKWGTPGNLDKNYVYDYDPLNRLKSGISNTGSYEKDITYDLMGNILSLNRNSGASQVYDYTGNGNRLNSVSGGLSRSYSYDVNGNVTSDGVNGMLYNDLNLIAEVTGPNASLYTYDARGTKLRRVAGGVTTDYLGELQIKDGVIDFLVTEEGIARPNGASDYNYEYTVKDHLGSTRFIFDTNGNKVQSDDYYPFGKTENSFVSGARNNYLYNGKELQEGIGQYDYGVRLYDPAIARWNVIDPMAENHYDTNPYHYVLNNPMLYMDYMGLDTTYNGNNMTDDDWHKYKSGSDDIDLNEVTIKGTRNSGGGSWGGYDQFNGFGDSGNFSLMMLPPPPPVLSSSSGAFTASDNRGGSPGRGLNGLTVLRFRLSNRNGSGGLDIKLGYKYTGRGLTNFNFVQTIRTNKPLGGARSPYNDPQPPDDRLPFYWTRAELPGQTNKNGYNVLFSDSPSRPMVNGTTWNAELSVVGRNSTGHYVPITTITYGFKIINNSVRLSPITTITPSAFQRRSIP